MGDATVKLSMGTSVGWNDGKISLSVCVGEFVGTIVELSVGSSVGWSVGVPI